MAMATYLDTVNNVLKRLREPTVTSPEETLYSTMVSVFVNDAKREIEDAHDWNVLSSTITINTEADVFGYSLEDSGTRFRTIDVLNNTSDWEMKYAPTSWMNRQFLLSPTLQKAPPTYYNFNGVDSKGDTRVDVWPVPDNVYALHFNLITPQLDLVDKDTKILVPSHLVAMLAYAKAIAERGEDNGNLASEAYALYKSALSNEIAIDRNRYEEEVNWVTP